MNMNEISRDITQVLDRYALPITAALLVFAIIIFLNRRNIKDAWLNVKTRRCLNKLGYKQIANFKCPDGLGHHFIIDRLILRKDGISLLLYKPYPGKIFCADKINDWTQMLGMKSYRFKNPLYDLEHQIKAVSACVSKVPVNGFLFFDHLTEFPKGHPDRIIYLENMPQELKRIKRDEVDASVMSAWDNLLLMAKG